MHTRRLISLLTACLLGAGCASTPEFDLSGVSRAVLPAEASTNPEPLKGQRIIWGGIIIESRNLAHGSSLEILAYPLDGAHRPDVAAKPLGRILARHPKYLETIDYAAGRLITVVGTFTGTVEGRVGEADYLYPSLTIDQHHLWPVGSSDPETRLHFGIGIMVR